MCSRDTVIAEHDHFITMERFMCIIVILEYFDVYCTSNEEAYLNLGISSSTYYRHIKPAIRAYAASLWCVVIPDLIIREHLQQSGSVTAQVEVS